MEPTGPSQNNNAPNNYPRRHPGHFYHEERLQYTPAPLPPHGYAQPAPLQQYAPAGGYAQPPPMQQQYMPQPLGQYVQPHGYVQRLQPHGYVQPQLAPALPPALPPTGTQGFPNHAPPVPITAQARQRPNNEPRPGGMLLFLCSS